VSPSSEMEPVFVKPSAAETRAVHGDPAEMTRQVYGAVEEDLPRPGRTPPVEVPPRRSKAERQREGSLARRADYLARRVAQEPRSASFRQSSFDRQELEALRWVLDDVLPGWFGRPR
jgi:hypothetical protein